MSVGGLAVAVGLIIDDAIVVIENIERNRRESPHEPIDDTITLSMTQLGVRDGRIDRDDGRRVRAARAARPA